MPQVYYTAVCKLGSIDCNSNWELRRTSLGNCLWLNTTEAYNSKRSLVKNGVLLAKDLMNESGEDVREKNIRLKVNMRNMLEREELPDANKINSLNIIIGYNQSDQTFGWNGFNNALQMYFFDPDEMFIANEKKVVLLPTLNPSVTLTQRVTELLGKPFTKCNRDANYSKRNCEVLEYMSKVVETCGCYPSYDYSYKTILTDQYWVNFLNQKKTNLIDFELTSKPCNFFEQSTCITSLQQGFDEKEFSYECLPKCYHSSIDQKKIHVSNLWFLF